MEDKRKNLIVSQQKKIITDVVESLNQLFPSFYYLSTIEVAAEIKKYIHEPSNLDHDNYELVKNLSREDIQILLSFHGNQVKH